MGDSASTRERIMRRLIALAHGDEHPAAFLAALDNAGVRQDFHMPADARLALSQHLCQFADRQLHRAHQRDDPEARRIGKRAEDVEGVRHDR